jgi:hypothetical protein
MVRLSILYLWWLADIEALLRSGKPIADANTMEPLFPDRAGVKMPWLKLIIKFIPSMPRLFANRPSVVDPRVHEASDPLPCVLGLVHEP